MSCNYHVKEALVKAAAKKRIKDFLTAREQFRFYLECEDDIEDYCWCGALLDYCDHCEDCEKYSANLEFIFCPSCGVEM